MITTLTSFSTTMFIIQTYKFIPTDIYTLNIYMLHFILYYKLFIRIEVLYIVQNIISFLRNWTINISIK